MSRMYTIEYVRKTGTKFMAMTERQFVALMKYSVQPDGGRIFGDAWLVRIHAPEYWREL